MRDSSVFCAPLVKQQGRSRQIAPLSRREGRPMQDSEQFHRQTSRLLSGGSDPLHSDVTSPRQPSESRRRDC